MKNNQSATNRGGKGGAKNRTSQRTNTNTNERTSNGNPQTPSKSSRSRHKDNRHKKGSSKSIKNQVTEPDSPGIFDLLGGSRR